MSLILYSDKMVFFMRLDGASVLPMTILRMLGFRVRYLDISSFFMKKKRNTIFTWMGIHWIDHQSDDYASFGYLMKECQSQIFDIGGKIISHGVCEKMAESNEDANIYNTIIYEYVHSSIKLPLELIFTSKTYSKLLGLRGEVSVWMPNTYVTRLLSSHYGEIRNLCPRWWLAIDFSIQVAVKLVNKISGKVSALEKKFVSLVRYGWGQSELESMGTQRARTAARDLYGCTVAFFPHQGVLYGDMYVKDHFYSEIEGDQFSAANITHIELEENLNRAAVDFYINNGIGYLYWSNVEKNIPVCGRSVWKYLCKILKEPVANIDLDLILKTSRSVWLVNSAISKLNKFYNLKVVLVGYDILFPQWLSVACRIKGIRTIAAQERMISAWWSPPLLFDSYLTMGPESTERLRLNSVAGVTYHQIGPIRLPKYVNIDLSRMKKDVDDMGIGYEAIVLAMDMHSNIDPIENGRALGNNWRINARFYRDLLSLSADFPKFIFLLKGKDVNFTKVSYLQELSDQIRSRKNIKILEDSSVWTPFSSVAIADIGFARHTSMADEMLALGKPVIFHDTYGFPSEVFDYGCEVTMHTYSQYADAFQEFKNDRLAFNAKYACLRRRLFGSNTNSSLGVQDILHAQP